MRGQAKGGASAEAEPLPSLLPLQAYKPFRSHAALAVKTAGRSCRHARPLPASGGWRPLAEKKSLLTPHGRRASPRKVITGEVEIVQESGICTIPWKSSPMMRRMSLHDRVALAESQGFLRAKVAAKEQLCSQVIGENQQLLRQLEESKARHHQAVERIKAEASAVVQHLLADTAVYRDTQENLAKKVELLQLQASNDALRALQAEKRCQDADEKLLVLKRFVGGLQEKQKVLEEEAHAFTAAFRHLKSAIQAFAANLAACNFSEDNKASSEQIPEMVALGINRMQLVLSETEARLLEKGFVKEVSAKGILQNISSDKPATMVSAAEVTRLQRERKMWENRFVRAEKELRATEKQLEEVKKECTRKADVLVKLRLKDHRFKMQESEVAAAKAKAQELQGEIEKLMKERDELAAWKASHPVYRGYRWDFSGGRKSASASRSSPAPDSLAKKRSSLRDSALGLLQPREEPKSGRGLSRTASQASLASSRRVSSIASLKLQKEKTPRSHSTPQAEGRPPTSPVTMTGSAASAPALPSVFEGKPRTLSRHGSAVSLDNAGMIVLKRSSRDQSARPADAKVKALGHQTSRSALPFSRQRSLTPLGDAALSSKARSSASGRPHLTLTLPVSPRAVVTPAFAHGTDAVASPRGQPRTGPAGTLPESPGDSERLAAFFSTAFSKAAAKEKELKQPSNEKSFL